MLITTRGRYGVKALFELAMSGGDDPIPLKQIARRQGLSEHYLEQIIAPLRKAGLVKSVRGAHGGYLLGAEPEEISVGDILAVLEGPLDEPEDESESDAPSGATYDVWEVVRSRIAATVDGMTLEKLCEEARHAQDQRYMFYI